MPSFLSILAIIVCLCLVISLVRNIVAKKIKVIYGVMGILLIILFCSYTFYCIVVYNLSSFDNDFVKYAASLGILDRVFLSILEYIPELFAIIYSIVLSYRVKNNKKQCDNNNEE